MRWSGKDADCAVEGRLVVFGQRVLVGMRFRAGRKFELFKTKDIYSIVVPTPFSFLRASIFCRS